MRGARFRHVDEFIGWFDGYVLDNFFFPLMKTKSFSLTSGKSCSGIARCVWEKMPAKCLCGNKRIKIEFREEQIKSSASEVFLVVMFVRKLSTIMVRREACEHSLKKRKFNRKESIRIGTSELNLLLYQLSGICLWYGLPRIQFI